MSGFSKCYNVIEVTNYDNLTRKQEVNGRVKEGGGEYL